MLEDSAAEAALGKSKDALIANVAKAKIGFLKVVDFFMMLPPVV